MGQKDRRDRAKNRGSNGEIIAFPVAKGANPPPQVMGTIAPDILIRHLDDLAKFQQHVENRRPPDPTDPSHSLRVGSLESLQAGVNSSAQVVLRDKKEEGGEDQADTSCQVRKFPHERGDAKP